MAWHFTAFGEMSSSNDDEGVQIPADWTDCDRRAYLKIALRRKDEHVAGYAVVSIGAQLFLNISQKVKDIRLVEAVSSEAEASERTGVELPCDPLSTETP